MQKRHAFIRKHGAFQLLRLLLLFFLLHFAQGDVLQHAVLMQLNAHQEQ